MSAPDPRTSAARGVAATAAAFALWGAFPLFWRQLAGVDAVELIAHRMVWSLTLLLPLVALRGRWHDYRATLTTPRLLGLHALSGWLLTLNWLVFVWAVNDGRIVESSLGYFLVPLLNVALGVWVLGERLRPAQVAALILAALGVGVQVVRFGQVPWVALGLAFTFGFYGLLRKRSPVGSLTGLAVETTTILPAALALLAWKAAAGTGALGAGGWGRDVLLLATGVVTAVPLLLFAAGARRIHLATVGLLQYLAPTGQFAVGVLVYGESFGPDRGWSFALIWAALAIYSIDGLRASRAPRAGPMPAPG